FGSFFIAPSSQRLESPRNPGRFTVEIKGFVSKKTGKSFSAMLVLQDKTTGAVSFEFAKKK
ncbi:topoisomerase C-terminal repeat-containing protein, partial [Pseudomonas amygdali]